MDSTDCKSAGRPRFDKIERLRHRFYEPLVLLSVLEPTQGPNPPYSSTNVVPSNFASGWRNFLDGLSFLCDFDKGGTTVSSVAGESTPSGTCFWLATSTGKARKAREAQSHLKWVLARLTQLHNAPVSSVEVTAASIEQRSNHVSQGKMKNYARRLCVSVESLKEPSHSRSKIVPCDDFLWAELTALVDLSCDHQKLSEACYGFVNRTSLEALDRTSTSSLEKSTWSSLRHYIGRLGSWKRISLSLARFVDQNPQVLDGFTVDLLILPLPVDAPAADHKTNVKSVLGRMLPMGEGQKVENLIAAVSSLPSIDITESFTESYNASTFRPRVHAELHLLEHFHGNRLEFVANERYIGCSKPSCYCCSLYIRYHPGNFVLRPSHGNLWRNWSPPLKWEDYGKGGKAKEVMNGMIAHVRRDVVGQIESRMSRKSKVPDSSIGE